LRIHDARLECGWLDPDCVERAQGSDGKSGIVELMTTEQPRRRQIHQPAVILIDQAPTLDIDVPFLSSPVERSAHPPGRLLDHRANLVDLLGANHRRATL